MEQIFISLSEAQLRRIISDSVQAEFEKVSKLLEVHIPAISDTQSCRKRTLSPELSGHPVPLKTDTFFITYFRTHITA